MITVGEDITDWRAIERTAQTEKRAALGQLAATVMHEINNPLATIAACAESIGLYHEMAVDQPANDIAAGSKTTERLRAIGHSAYHRRAVHNHAGARPRNSVPRRGTRIP